MVIEYKPIDTRMPWQDDVEKGAPCFYCSKALEFPSIIWNGHESYIIMHPECALKMCVRLIVDVHRVEINTK